MNPRGWDLVFVRYMMIVLCLLLSSCKHQSSRQKSKSNVGQLMSNNRNALFDTIIQQEAMLIDIPIPLYDERIIPYPFLIESDTLVFGYKSSLSPIQLVDFFLHQMERFGWQHLVSFEAAEILMQFQSPDRYCTVVIKNGEQEHGSSIFIYIKRASTEARS